LDNDTSKDTYEKATFQLAGASGTTTKNLYQATTMDGAGQVTAKNEHIGAALDIDQQDLKGKRSRPPHYEYVVLRNGTDYIYAVGAFGDGNGLKLGTGYAVCEINLPSIKRKYVGTWKRYKPLQDSITHFTNDTTLLDQSDEKSTAGCPLPDALAQVISDPGNGNEPTIIGNMRAMGWEF
jgi:hypothetical protein